VPVLNELLPISLAPFTRGSNIYSPKQISWIAALWHYRNTLKIFAPRHNCRGNRMILYFMQNQGSSSFMLPSMQEMPVARKAFDIAEIRDVIARHLDVDVERVTDDASFADDLGADWLDRIELIILIEDRLGSLEITDEDADRIQVVGDLMRYIESGISGQKL
jgi:acyl carrier protein